MHWSLFFNEVADLGLVLYLKKELERMCLSVHFTKFYRTSFFTKHLRATAFLVIYFNFIGY